MRTGILIGWKGAKPEILKAGTDISAQNSEYKKLLIAASKGGGSYDKVELFVDSRSFAKKAGLAVKKKKDPELLDANKG